MWLAAQGVDSEVQCVQLWEAGAPARRQRPPQAVVGNVQGDELGQLGPAVRQRPCTRVRPLPLALRCIQIRHVHAVQDSI